MQCITTTSFSVLTNDNPGESFRPKIGFIRRTISPSYLLFILNILLDIFILCLILQNLELAVKLQKEDPCSLLMLADDCLISCKANKKVARFVKAILRDYCNVLRQLVNFHKSMVHFSNGIENR